MHLLLTDRLVCPRCGPAFGLILRADGLEDRRVRDGELGCPNCRERYPVRAGVADLRPPPRGPLAPTAPPEVPGDDAAMAAAAAMGLAGARGMVLLVGGAAGLAAPLGRLLPADDVELVRAARGTAEDGNDAAGGVIHADVLPFADATFTGVALRGDELESRILREAVRVLARGGRVAVLDPPEDVRLRLGGAGLTRFVEGPGLAAAGR